MLTSLIQELQNIVSRFEWMDLLDVLIVAFIFYVIFTLVKGTRAIQMMLGVMIITAVFSMFSILTPYLETKNLLLIFLCAKRAFLPSNVCIIKPCLLLSSSISSVKNPLQGRENVPMIFLMIVVFPERGGAVKKMFFFMEGLYCWL